MPERHDEEGHGKWLDQFLDNHSGPDGQPRADLWRQGLLDFVQLDVDASIFWSPIGPAPLNINPAAQYFQGVGPNSGEITDIAIDPSGATDDIILVATNDGGVWRSTDGGTTWFQTMDQLLSLSMGAIAIDQSNPQVVYAGTGNLYDGGRAFKKGVGLYRSSDSGLTWSIVDGGPFATIFAGSGRTVSEVPGQGSGTSGFGINRIVIPAPNKLLVATDQGLFRSEDGGLNFGSNSPSFDNRQPIVNGFISGLVADTVTAGIFYACVVGVGVLASTDGGMSFPVNLFSNPGAPAPPFGNLEVAQSTTPNNQTLLALVQFAPGPNPTVVLYRSTNGGTQWSPISNIAGVASVPPDSFTQTDYDLVLGIDPQNAQTVYVGFQELWRSNDGGTTFQSPACTSSQVHWDTHVLTFSPSTHRTGAPTALYLGTDGGIARSANGGSNWVAINGEIGSNLFRGIDIGRGAGNNAYTYGGCQDTGTSGHGPADSGTTVWHEGIDGDGYFVAVDPTDPTVVYGFDDWDFIKSSDGGTTWQTTGTTPRVIGNNLPTPHGDLTRAIALEQNGNNKAARVVYVGVVQDLYKSVDAGLNFVRCALNVGGKITALTTTTADSNRVWVGVSNSSVHYSADAGATWDQGSFQTQPGGLGPARGIAVDPTNASRVAVVYGGVSGIHSKYRTKRIFLTLDNGVTWNDVSGTDGNGPIGNLPDLTMHSVVFDTSTTPNPPAIVVASDGGVMRSTDVAITAGNVTATWKIYGAGLPTVCCNSLAIDNTVSPPVLRVGTYGRSCFEVTRPTGPVMNVESNLAFGATALNQTATVSIYVYNCGDAPLTVTGISPTGGPTDFDVSPSATFPATIAPGGTQSFDMTFKPTSAGDARAAFDIASNDSGSPYLILASGRGITAPLTPRLGTNPISQTGFGTVSSPSDRTLPLQLFNVGTADLHISAINRKDGSSDFTIDPAPAFPMTIAPGAETDVTLKYHPTGNGDAKATFQIVSDDPHSPRSVVVTGTGAAVSGSLWPIILVLLGVAAVAGGVIAYEELKKK